MSSRWRFVDSHLRTRANDAWVNKNFGRKTSEIILRSVVLRGLKTFEVVVKRGRVGGGGGKGEGDCWWLMKVKRVTMTREEQ